jgi:3-oxocholest-4-en-26-oyl-CoA dehydrogenase beta subunit
MDFELSESQQELAALTRRILDDQVTQPRLRAAADSGVLFDRPLWSTLADAGVIAAALPDNIGGGGLDFLEQCSILIELGRAVAPVPYLTSVLSTAAIGYFGDDEQRSRWAAPAAAGELVLTAALAEDLVDSPETPQTRAERVERDGGVGAGWRLNGSKAVVPYASVADAFLVPAGSDDGVKLFVVLPGDEGVSLEPQRLLDGDTVATLDLAGVEVDDTRHVAGRDVVHWLVSRATVALAAFQTGVLERALELTADYARERKQFDRPIGSFQAVAQRLADAYIDVEAVRLTMWEAAWRIAEPLPCPTEIATAKFWAADAGHRVAHTVVHVHGGTGIDLDAATHRYFTAAKRTEFTLGGATAQLRRLGAELASSPA